MLAPADNPANRRRTGKRADQGARHKAAQDKFLDTGAELVPDALIPPRASATTSSEKYERATEAAKIAGLKPAWAS